MSSYQHGSCKKRKLEPFNHGCSRDLCGKCGMEFSCCGKLIRESKACLDGYPYAFSPGCKSHSALSGLEMKISTLSWQLPRWRALGATWRTHLFAQQSHFKMQHEQKINIYIKYSLALVYLDCIWVLESWLACAKKRLFYLDDTLWEHVWEALESSSKAGIAMLNNNLGPPTKNMFLMGYRSLITTILVVESLPQKHHVQTWNTSLIRIVNHGKFTFLTQ